MLGSTQASCSFHLRQLAKYGYVEEADPRPDARARPWQITDYDQSWSTADGGAAAEELERVFVQREADRIMEWRPGDQTEEWKRSGWITGSTLPMTASEMAEVRQGIAAILEPFLARVADRASWPVGHRLVRILSAGTPIDHLNASGASS